MPMRRIDVHRSDERPIDVEALIALLAKEYEDGYRLTPLPAGAARIEFLSIGGPQPAFDLVPISRDTIAVELYAVERDYVTAARVAEELARRHGGSAVDRTTGARLWPPIDGGEAHPAILRTLITVEIDDGESERLISALLAAAHRCWPAALPRCFSASEPFLCETPGDEQAFLAECARRARDGGSLFWLATYPALDGSLRWPRRDTLFPAPVRLRIGVATDALDDARPFVAELAATARAVISEGGAVQLRLGTTWDV